jgi:farnesyl diphosphate synthase
MSFEQRLAAVTHPIEAHLEALLSADRHPDVPERLLAAMRHGVLGRGKRFRPLLVIETARMLGKSPDEALGAAAAFELVHCYSLIHDDLPAMDNDTLRRGQPTVWTAYDEWTAILSGDALLTLAFEVMAHVLTAPDPDIRADLVACLARAAGPSGMVGGQALDLAVEKLGIPARPDAGYVRRLHGMKTGALIVGAVEAGAILAKAKSEQRAALHRYAGLLGYAFQLSDDLLDAEGDAATVGKAVAKDAALGKATLVGLDGAQASRVVLQDAVKQAMSALQEFGPVAKPLCDAARYMAERRK